MSAVGRKPPVLTDRFRPIAALRLGPLAAKVDSVVFKCQRCQGRISAEGR